MSTDSFWRNYTWERGERLYITSLSGSTGLNIVGNKVVETETGAETTGSDDQKRSSQCHYVCIK